MEIEYSFLREGPRGQCRPDTARVPGLPGRGGAQRVRGRLELRPVYILFNPDSRTDSFREGDGFDEPPDP